MQSPKQNGKQVKRLLLSCFLTVRGKYGTGKGVSNVRAPRFPPPIVVALLPCGMPHSHNLRVFGTKLPYDCEIGTNIVLNLSKKISLIGKNKSI